MANTVVLCPHCKAANETSRVTDRGTRVTLMGWSPGYYDEQGKWVANRDPNWRTTDYSCSRGHSFDVVRREGEPDRIRPSGGGGPTHHPADEIIVPCS